MTVMVFDVTSLLPLKSKVMQVLMHSPLNKHCFYISLTFFACCSKYTQNFDTTAFPYGFPLSGSPTRRFSKCSEKYKKTADFLRNQRLNVVAGTGLEPAASGLWVIASILRSSKVQYNVYVSIPYTLYIVRAVVCRILYLHCKEQIKNNIRAAIISFSPGNRWLDSAMQNSYTKGNKRALSTDG